MSGAIVLVIMLAAVGYVWLCLAIGRHLRTNKERHYPKAPEDR